MRVPVPFYYSYLYIALPWMEFENNPNVDVFHVVCHDEVPGSKIVVVVEGQ